MKRIKGSLLVLMALTMAIVAGCSTNQGAVDNYQNRPNQVTYDGNRYAGNTTPMTPYGRVTYPANPTRDQLHYRTPVGSPPNLTQNPNIAPPYNNTSYDGNNVGRNGRVGTTGMMDNLNAQNRKAEHLARLASRVRGVDDAQVYLRGNTAYINVDIQGQINNNQAKRIENEVRRVVKRHDPNVRYQIMSDKGMFNRIINTPERVGNRIGNMINAPRYNAPGTNVDTRSNTNGISNMNR
ncbi:YhcN/YlaJ family sporulation lipoprotein [Rubeoparvulum massiliense]|uniref:YhcN/YlaJ family sporulation lipoprotein n=1 Tax=Rubeoparvulum massiliense TaxID=1631346 RepID=UPI00065E722C|nr:YhcN/YlaJ family sporulation lipoprotein [Rubeoparvulum massiliense]